MPRQLVLPLPALPALGRGDFFVSPANAAAVALVSDDDGWPEGKLALTGPAGSGKTHLAHVWAAERGALIVSGDALAGADVPGLAAAGRIAVEGVGPSGPEGETALFHLHNLLRETGGRLLVTARTPPAQWRIALPDLGSRLQSMTVATLAPPDDALLAAVLVKLFADRQIAVPPRLIDYLLPRIDRSFDAARNIVERLDRMALERGGPVTRALAARLLDNSPGKEA